MFSKYAVACTVTMFAVINDALLLLVLQLLERTNTLQTAGTNVIYLLAVIRLLLSVVR